MKRLNSNLRKLKSLEPRNRRPVRANMMVKGLDWLSVLTKLA